MEFSRRGAVQRKVKTIRSRGLRAFGVWGSTSLAKQGTKSCSLCAFRILQVIYWTELPNTTEVGFKLKTGLKPASQHLAERSLISPVHEDWRMRPLTESLTREGWPVAPWPAHSPGSSHNLSLGLYAGVAQSTESDPEPSPQSPMCLTVAVAIAAAVARGVAAAVAGAGAGAGAGPVAIAAGGRGVVVVVAAAAAAAAVTMSVLIVLIKVLLVPICSNILVRVSESSAQTFNHTLSLSVSPLVREPAQVQQ